MAKIALITGVSGQDGAYLSKFLLERGYRVLGQVQHSAPPQMARLTELGIERDIEIVEMDLFNLTEMQKKLDLIRPDELYNLAGQSSVAHSFTQPTMPLEVNAVAAARLLEAARLAIPDVRFFQASSAEMFGKVSSSPQNESTPFRPCSPYGVARLFSHWQTVSYREAYKLFASCGILFNHESPLRGRQFVTRKITSELAQVKHGCRDRISLGNLNVRRDWGFAGDYVEGMWGALQQQKPDDYVFATGRSNSVRMFVELAAECLGILLEWSGSELAEVGIDRKTSRVVVDVNPAFFRSAEILETVGDAQRAYDKLGWSPVTDLPALVAMMATADERRLLDNRSLV
jgi:GDPmannose 4,6-dehydratase